MDRTFTVQNTSGASLSGSASVGAPFRIVTGASFSLAPGASQAVTVRFQPTSAGSFAGNATFTANGDTVSRGVSGATTGAGPTTATLSVTRSGSGAGTVTSAPAGISCGSDCTETVATGTSLTLTATAAGGSTFAGWSGGCSGTGTCTVAVNGATTVTATFNGAPAPPSGGAPGAPGQVTATQTAADAGGVTFALAWSPGSGAASYRYTAGFGDGSGSQQGTVSSLTVQLRMPYHASGAATAGFVCLRSVSAGGVTSADAACAGLSVPARPTSTSPAPTISGLSPSTPPAGGDGFTLTVNGSGFVSSSVVRWNGAGIPTTFVSPTQLQATVGATSLAAAGSVPVTVVTPAPGGGTSSALTFTVTATAPGPPPGSPANVTVSQVSADAGGVTFALSWSAGSGATSYRWVAGFNDGSAPDQGTVTATSVQLRRPYQANGAAADGFVCVRSVGPTGQTSAEQACNALRVPARP